MFRPQANAARFNSSAAADGHAGAAGGDVRRTPWSCWSAQDREWVPGRSGHSLYLRPFMIATQAGLGREPAVAGLPVHGHRLPGRGLLLRRGQAGLGLAVATDYTRAAPGGTGEAKCGGNYAAAFAGPARGGRDTAATRWSGWTPREHRWVEEMGGMNLFFVYGSGAQARIMTPALTGTLLPGITRDSLLKLAPDARPARSRRAGSRSTSGRPAAPPARSPRCSPAAPPRSSPRSAGSRARDGEWRSATATRPISGCRELIGIQTHSPTCGE